MSFRSDLKGSVLRTKWRTRLVASFLVVASVSQSCRVPQSWQADANFPSAGKAEVESRESLAGEGDSNSFTPSLIGPFPTSSSVDTWLNFLRDTFEAQTLPQSSLRALSRRDLATLWQKLNWLQTLPVRTLTNQSAPRLVRGGLPVTAERTSLSYTEGFMLREVRKQLLAEVKIRYRSICENLIYADREQVLARPPLALSVINQLSDPDALFLSIGCDLLKDSYPEAHGFARDAFIRYLLYIDGPALSSGGPFPHIADITHQDNLAILDLASMSTGELDTWGSTALFPEEPGDSTRKAQVLRLQRLSQLTQSLFERLTFANYRQPTPRETHETYKSYIHDQLSKISLFRAWLLSHLLKRAQGTEIPHLFSGAGIIYLKTVLFIARSTTGIDAAIVPAIEGMIAARENEETTDAIRTYLSSLLAIEAVNNPTTKQTILVPRAEWITWDNIIETSIPGYNQLLGLTTITDPNRDKAIILDQVVILPPGDRAFFNEVKKAVRVTTLTKWNEMKALAEAGLAALDPLGIKMQGNVLTASNKNVTTTAVDKPIIKEFFSQLNPLLKFEELINPERRRIMILDGSFKYADVIFLPIKNGMIRSVTRAQLETEYTAIASRISATIEAFKTFQRDNGSLATAVGAAIDSESAERFVNSIQTFQNAIRNALNDLSALGLKGSIKGAEEYATYMGQWGQDVLENAGIALIAAPIVIVPAFVMAPAASTIFAATSFAFSFALQAAEMADGNRMNFSRNSIVGDTLLGVALGPVLKVPVLGNVTRLGLATAGTVATVSNIASSNYATAVVSGLGTGMTVTGFFPGGRKPPRDILTPSNRLDLQSKTCESLLGVVTPNRLATGTNQKICSVLKPTSGTIGSIVVPPKKPQGFTAAATQAYIDALVTSPVPHVFQDHEFIPEEPPFAIPDGMPFRWAKDIAGKWILIPDFLPDFADSTWQQNADGEWEMVPLYSLPGFKDKDPLKPYGGYLRINNSADTSGSSTVPYDLEPIETLEARELTPEEEARLIEHLKRQYPSEYRRIASGIKKLLKEKKALKALIAYVATMLVTYPGHDILFLGRDAEMIYDVAIIFYPSQKSRFKLINFSRDNMTWMRQVPSQKVIGMRYLSDLGLTSGHTASVVLVDTGYEGSLQRRIVEFTNRTEGDFPKSHFLESASKDRIPNFAPFLTVGPMIMDVEDIPKSFASSSSFEVRNDKVVPMARKNSGEELEFALKIRGAFKHLMNKLKTDEPGVEGELLEKMKLVYDAYKNPALLDNAEMKARVKAAFNWLKNYPIRNLLEIFRDVEVVNFRASSNEVLRRIEIFLDKLNAVDAPQESPEEEVSWWSNIWQWVVTNFSSLDLISAVAPATPTPTDTPLESPTPSPTDLSPAEPTPLATVLPLPTPEQTPPTPALSPTPLVVGW